MRGARVSDFSWSDGPAVRRKNAKLSISSSVGIASTKGAMHAHVFCFCPAVMLAGNGGSLTNPIQSGQRSRKDALAHSMVQRAVANAT